MDDCQLLGPCDALNWSQKDEIIDIFLGKNWIFGRLRRLFDSIFRCPRRRLWDPDDAFTEAWYSTESNLHPSQRSRSQLLMVQF